MAVNVYAIEASGDYAGGLAIVAADSAEAARTIVAALSSSWPWRVQYGDPNEVILLAGVQADGSPRVLTHYEMGA